LSTAVESLESLQVVLFMMFTDFYPQPKTRGNPDFTHRNKHLCAMAEGTVGTVGTVAKPAPATALELLMLC
jgi:hypothetical protein